MVGCIVLIIIGALIGFWFGRDEYYYDSVTAVLLVILGALIGSLASLLISMAVADTANKEIYKKSEDKIYALSDNTVTKGNFFLGSGYINDSMRYVFITEGKGGKTMKSVNTDDTFINENTNEEPRIEYYHTRFKNKNLEKYFFGIFNNEFKHNVIYIPDDSINHQYNIDLE